MSVRKSKPTRPPAFPEFSCRDVTLVSRRGAVLAYASHAAVRATTIGFNGMTLAASALPRFLRRTPITLHTSGRPRLMLVGFRLSVSSDAHPLPEGGWAADAAIGTFRSLGDLGSRRSPRPIRR